MEIADVQINGLDAMDDNERRDIADWLTQLGGSIIKAGADNAAVLKARYYVGDSNPQTDVA